MKTTLLFALLFLCAAFTNSSTAQNTFVVNTWSDGIDINPGDGVCVSKTGACSFRAAIEEANALPNSGGHDRILFTDIPIFVWFALIEIIGDPLPAITSPVFIDGTTAAGAVILDGNSITAKDPAAAILLEIGSGGSTVKGLTLGNFHGHLIQNK